MKTLLACIIIGLLSLSPAFAESSLDGKQKETDQNRSSEQTDVQRQTEQPVEERRTEQTGEKAQKPDEGRQVNETDQDRRYGQTDEGRQGATDQDSRYGQTGDQLQVSPRSDSYQESEQGIQPDFMPKSNEGRQSATDRVRTHRATEVEPQEGYQRVTSDLITADDLQGANVYGPDNESVADVKDVLMTPEGKVERVVVDVGGFLGMGARNVAIDLDEADIHKNADNDVRVNIPLSKEELRQMPEYKRGN